MNVQYPRSPLKVSTKLANRIGGLQRVCCNLRSRSISKANLADKRIFAGTW